MQPTRRRVLQAARVVLAVLLLAMFACNRGPRVEILIATSKPYDSVMARVRSVNGVVRYEYRNIDAIAATIPVARLAAFEAMPEVVAIEKDREIRLSKLRGDLEGTEPSTPTRSTRQSRAVTSFASRSWCQMATSPSRPIS